MDRWTDETGGQKDRLSDLQVDWQMVNESEGLTDRLTVELTAGQTVGQTGQTGGQNYR